MEDKLILGAAGTFGSGKDSLCEYLAERHSFLFVSTSDMVRQEAMKRYDSIERPILYQTGTELRQERGGGVLVELALEQFALVSDKYAGVAISGIRSMGEFKAIKAAGGTMIFTDAPAGIRFQRMKDRNRDQETQITLEQFKEREAREASSGPTDADFNIIKIGQEADYIITNETTFEDFKTKVEELYQKLSSK